MNTKDAYRIGIRLLGIYFGGCFLVGLGYVFAAYWTSSLFSNATASSLDLLGSLKLAPSQFIYPILNGLICLILLKKTELFVRAFEKIDQNNQGQPPVAG